MIAFQLIAIPLCVVFAITAFTRRRALTRRQSFFWVFLWLAAGITIALPNLSNAIAHFLGIGRGADLIVYAVAFIGMLLARYFYLRQRRLEMAITSLVRAEALSKAQRGLLEESAHHDAV